MVRGERRIRRENAIRYGLNDRLLEVEKLVDHKTAGELCQLFCTYCPY